MVEDEDGTPDDDIPALDRSRDINKFGIDAVALCDNPLAAERTDRRKPAASDGLRLQVFYGEDAHVLPVDERMVLADILPVLALKRNVDSMAQHLFQCFLKRDEHQKGAEPLNWSRLLTSLGGEDLLVRPRINVQTLVTLRATALPDSSLDAASAAKKEAMLQYREFRVVKINQRGKRQDRKLGLDRDWLYNKHTDEETSFSFFRLDITTAKPSMRDVIEARPVKGGPGAFAFQIVTKDGAGIVTIDFEAATEADRQDILEAINYLASLPAPSTS